MNVGVLLAAGASTRMGGPKALARSQGASFLVQGVRHLWAVCDRVIVVLGADARRIRAASEREFGELVERGTLVADGQLGRRVGPSGLEVRFIVNRAWRRGMLSSARAGLAEALRTRAAGALVLPVDHPRVRPDTVRELGAVLADALKAFGGSGRGARGFAYALVPRHRGRRGHPVAMSPALARAIVADHGAHDLGDAIRRHARLVGYLDVADGGVLVNRNTPAH